MNKSFKSFLNISEQDRISLFEETAERLDTLSEYIEKDFWVCLVLDALYNDLPDGHAKNDFRRLS